MRAKFSNFHFALDSQAAINRMTRSWRKRRDFRRRWHSPIETCTGSVFMDGLLGIVFGTVTVLFFIT